LRSRELGVGEGINSDYFLAINPIMGSLKPQSNGLLYSNTVSGTLAVGGWAVTFGTARRGLGWLSLVS